MKLTPTLQMIPMWLRYVVVMGLTWLIDFATFALASYFFGIPVSQALARGVGAVAGFLMHKFGTFKDSAPTDQRANTAAQFWKYAVLWLFGWAASTALILGLMQWLMLDKLVAKFIAELSLVPINYLLMRRFIFRPKER
jgi:putative flippase GtrA